MDPVKTPPDPDPATSQGVAVRVLELSPRCSLTPKSARYFIAAVAAPTFGIAGILTLQGFWPVLPFAGLEIAVLVWAVRTSMRASAERETIAISDEWITLTRGDGAREWSSVFHRHWTRVTLHAPLAALHPSRLTLESRGRVCEVGRFLTEDERRSLAVRLKQLVGNVNESPAL
jgi:uncharacterized membrane protein